MPVPGTAFERILNDDLEKAGGGVETVEFGHRLILPGDLYLPAPGCDTAAGRLEARRST